MALKKNIIRKIYPATTHILNEKDSMFYALAYNEDNDAYFDERREGGTIVPPMYAVRYMGESIDNILKDPDVGLDFSMMVHHSQEFEWIRPVKAGDEIESIARITDILPGQFGEKLVCSVESRCGGESVANSRWVFLDRSNPDPEADMERPKKYTGEPAFNQQVNVRNGQTFIYAHASGDFNAIHIDDEKAKEAGLGGIILHGLCTMAFTHKVCVDVFGGGVRDPLTVKKLSVQFARPVKPGDELTYKIFPDDQYPDNKYNIKLVNQKNKDIFYYAWCEVKSGNLTVFC